MYFQDYNEEVLRLWTIPNILLNVGTQGLLGSNPQNELSGCRFTSGDWNSMKFSNMFRKGAEENKDPKFKLILGCDVIYEVKHYDILLQIFEEKLEIGGMAIIASKAYYYGNGGSVAAFEEAVGKSGRNLKFEELESIQTGMGNRRSIFKVERLPDNNC